MPSESIGNFFLSLLVLALVACASQHPEPLRPGETVGVGVLVDRGFSIRLVGTRGRSAQLAGLTAVVVWSVAGDAGTAAASKVVPSGTGVIAWLLWPIAVLVGGATAGDAAAQQAAEIAQGVLSEEDRELLARLRERLSELHLEEPLGSATRSALERLGMESVECAAGSRCSAPHVLEIRVSNWGLLQCLGEAPEMMRIAVDLNVRSHSVAGLDRGRGWESVFQNGECTNAAELFLTEGKLEAELTGAVQRLSARIATEFVYP